MLHASGSNSWTVVGLLLLSNSALIFSVLVFAIGFFPYKPVLPGEAQWEDDNLSRTAPFDKVIFMVVDALRSDFVYSNNSGFLTLQELIRSGAAIPFTAHAAPPTITMPKVKAMTTGSIPSFLDVILNFAESDTSSTLSTQDTWPSQLKRKPDGKDLIMYGDDTWLKLFPGLFARADGTSSFFVSDFTEVDNNVTRHIPRELANADWNAMIMHYLGLDHIGHKSGPLSPHMLPKQRELDAIVGQIYRALETEHHLASTLLVLCGDHGMNEAGNHGGSAEGETSPALVFLSPKLAATSHALESPATPHSGEFGFYNIVEQSDIAPTLAGLLGFPIPLNNLGVFIPRMLDMWEDELLFKNARQMSRIIEANFDINTFNDQLMNDCDKLGDEHQVLWCMWKQLEGKYVNHDSEPKLQAQSLLEFLRCAQSIMSNAATDYGVDKLYVGMTFALLSAICAIAASSMIRSLSTGPARYTIALAVANGATMFASSFVEEEQHFWYWAASAWFATLFIRSTLNAGKYGKYPAFRGLGLAILFRILRRWNQTGQKHAGEADIGRTFLSGHTKILWFLVTLAMLDMCHKLASHGFPGFPAPIATILAFAICLVEICFKLSFTMADAPELLQFLPLQFKNYIGTGWLIVQARVVYVALLATMFYTLYQGSKNKMRRNVSGRSLHTILTMFLVTQSRVNNIPVFLLFSLALHSIRGLGLGPNELSLTSIVLQYASFFALGGSNAISSIDLSNAYNGVSGYNVGAVGILTYFGNWAGPVWWAMTITLLFIEKDNFNTAVWLKHLCLLTALSAIGVVSVMAACTILRTHLFIWTVFSPKYLFMMAWTLGQHVGINIILSSLLLVFCS